MTPTTAGPGSDRTVTRTARTDTPAPALSDSPIEGALRAIDDISMDLRALLSSDPDGSRWPGLARLMDAVSRLAKAIRIPHDDGVGGEFATYCDPGIVRSFANNTRALVSSAHADRWDASVAFDLAMTIEEYIGNCADQYVRDHIKNLPTNGDRVITTRNLANAAQQAVHLDKRLYEQLASVDAIVGNVKQAAGVVAEGKLSEAFKEYSTSEMSGATLYRRLALGVLIAVIGFSVYTAIWLPSGLGSSLAHLGIGLSSLTAFGYLARESAQHRKAARWASVLSVQLRTLDAYSAEMTPEQREILREHFGRRVFAEPMYALDGQEANGGDPTPLIQAAIDLIKVARGS